MAADNNKHIYNIIRGYNVSPFLFALLLLFLASIPFSSFSSNQEIDSLTSIITSPSSYDTSKVSALLSLGETIYMNNPDSALLLFEHARDLAINSLTKKHPKAIKWALNMHLAVAYNNIGFIYSIKGDILTSLDYYMKSMHIRKKINDKVRLASSYINIGYVYYNLGDMSNALKYFTKALKLKESLNDKQGIMLAINNIAGIFSSQKNYYKALQLYKHSLKIAQAINDSNHIALLKHNVGILYLKLSRYDSAKYFLQKSLLISKLIKNNYRVSYCLQSIGKLYLELENYDSAFVYIKKAIEKSKTLSDKNELIESYTTLSDAYLKINKIKEAEKYGILAYKLSKEIGYPDYIQNSAELMSRIFLKTNDYKNAYKYYTEYVRMKDSLINDKNQKDLYNQQAKYKYEKKAAIDSLNHIKEIKIKNLEIKRQATQRNFLIIGLIITLLGAFYIYRNYKQKAEMNRMLAEQKEELQVLNENLNQQNEEIRAQRDEIEEQKKVIESIYNELSESINYAKNLQSTIFPDKKILENHLQEYFIFFRPKDKVSGDFYWWSFVENKLVIAVADCTGHGVPGAFMSMLGVTLLREIVHHNKITDTSRILRLLRLEIINTLKQKGNIYEHKDGIDMSIVTIDAETHTLQYSGANNSIYYITNANEIPETETVKMLFEEESTKMYEFKADKMPVGIYKKMNEFSSFTVNYLHGDIIYMFSDGYADQFGGSKFKKFKSKRLKKLLFEISRLPMNMQFLKVESEFINWKKDVEQIDDVTLAGFKLL